MNNTQSIAQEVAVRAGPSIQRFTPEGVFAAMLVSIAAYLGVTSVYLDTSFGVFIQQFVVVVLFIGSSTFLHLCRHHHWTKACRCLIFFGFISYLYNALAGLAFNHVPWLSDGTLFSFDVLLGIELFHTQIAPAVTQVRWITELLSIGYAAFVPYLLVSVFLHGTQRNAQLREMFLLSLALLYAISFLGYLFVPAHGPVLYLDKQFASSINSGFFHSIVTNSVNQAGGPHGAFPSIHVGAAVLMCLFDFKHGNRSRGWLYLPLVLVIGLATVMLRYHYVVDLIAGVGIAFTSLFIAERWFSKKPDVALGVQQSDKKSVDGMS